MRQIGIYHADYTVGRGLAPAAENGTFSVFLKENMNLSPTAIPFCGAKWTAGDSQPPYTKREFESGNNHNHRPCRWFAQAPLGPITS